MATILSLEHIPPTLSWLPPSASGLSSDGCSSRKPLLSLHLTQSATASASFTHRPSPSHQPVLLSSNLHYDLKSSYFFVYVYIKQFKCTNKRKIRMETSHYCIPSLAHSRYWPLQGPWLNFVFFNNSFIFSFSFFSVSRKMSGCLLRNSYLRKSHQQNALAIFYDGRWMWILY